MLLNVLASGSQDGREGEEGQAQYMGASSLEEAHLRMNMPLTSGPRLQDTAGQERYKVCVLAITYLLQRPTNVYPTSQVTGTFQPHDSISYT